MAVPVWTNVTVPLSSLVPWEHNPRTLTKRQAQRLLKSWAELGQFQTVAIGPGGEVYDGHQRLSALLAAYGGEYAVDARQSDRALDDDERQALTLAANVPAGAWDWSALAAWDTDTLTKWGMDDETLATWYDDAANLREMLGVDQPHEDADAESQINRAAELNEKWQVQRGDLWHIGEHRLICGDSTQCRDVDQVVESDQIEMVWTDPPYGVAVGDKNKFLNSISKNNRVEENLINDTLDEDGLADMLCAAFDNAISHCLAGAAWYVAAPAGPLHLIFGMVLKDRGIWRQTIQWVKNNSTFSPLGVCYHWQAEPIFFGWLPNGAHRYYGGRNQTTVWNIDRPLASHEHPTMKPVELVSRAIQNSSLTGEIVFDPFAGSGTTLVACQNSQRKCRAIEISPNYCAVILERMSTAFPGIEIERIET